MNNTLVRFGLPLAVIVVLVFGLTYISQNAPSVGNPKPAPVAAAKQHGGPALLVPFERASWAGNEPPDMPTHARYGKEMEPGAHGHYDFWIANIHDVPANVQLTNTSCKCAKVELAMIDPAAVSGLIARAGLPVNAPLDRAAVEKLLEAAAQDAAMLNGLTWKPLVRLDPSTPIDKADPKTGLRLAVIRLDFHPPDPGNLLITATISSVGGGDGKVAQNTFEVPVTIVPPVQAYPEVTNLGEMRAGEVKQAELYLWSATRDSFPLTLPDLPEDPTIVFSKPELLTGPAVVAELKRLRASRAGTKPRTGYKVVLTVHESLNEKLLELGPLQRKLVFNVGTPFEATCELKGTVRGDVRLIDANGAGVDRIKLGEFEADRGTAKSLTLQGFQPGMKYRVVSVHPEALKVELREKSAGNMLWELKVEVPKSAIAGPLAYSSSVVLEILSEKGRRVRIPIEGNAMIR